MCVTAQWVCENLQQELLISLWTCTCTYSLLIIRIEPCGRSSLLALVSSFGHSFLQSQVRLRYPHFIPNHFTYLDYSCPVTLCCFPPSVFHSPFCWPVMCASVFMRFKGPCEGLPCAHTSFIQIGLSSIGHCCLSAAPNVKSIRLFEIGVCWSLRRPKQPQDWLRCHRKKTQ